MSISMSTSKLFEKELKKTTNINLHVVDLGGGTKQKNMYSATFGLF